ncbi:PTS sugar transporter subunit IIA [uncultured Fusobacterium sp.]|jgi:PTS system nitrogen regulatory IIA component|uniref:PTS sugar transporter subunit IIA n=1 Tax=uncultured Fusobacterium sp. TaxID=159267 RepID=UPI0025F59740|nr:PTS sugar transporter subunit IIA [uncultured Fusobacterium sp.]
MINVVKITDYMSEDLISLKLKSKNKDDVLMELADLIAVSPEVHNEENVIYKALIEREKLGSTGIGKGVAIPHAKTDAADRLTIAFGISKEKIDFKSLDNENVNIFFVFASPMKDSQVYLKVLARISRLIREEEFRNELLACKTPAEVIECINKKETV